MSIIHAHPPREGGLFYALKYPSSLGGWAISIPIFTSQLEKAREATDLANLRLAYAECSAAVLTETDTGNATYSADTHAATETVVLKQKVADWTDGTDATIGGIALPTPTGTGNQSVTVTVYNNGTTSTIK